ncbi:hypothetical protein [Brumimicrobium oceani]|nr:hypothetical protein [Brumimicrobium oceani]
MGLKHFLLLLTLIFGGLFVTAQESKEDIDKQAQALFRKGEYLEATPLFLRLLSLEPRNPNYNYKYGTCLLYNADKNTEAFRYLNYSIQKDSEVDAEAYYYLGKAYHLTYRFNKAIKNYELYKQKAGARALEELQVDRQIEMCRNGKTQFSDITETIVLEKTQIDLKSFFRIYDLKDIGGNLIVAEEFQSKQDKKNNHTPLIHFPINSDYIYYSSYGSGSENKDIYFRYRTTNGEWSKESPVLGDVNTPYNEDYPYMHPNGKYLYFSSEGHKSMGGYDVFRSEYDQSTNTFGIPENMNISISSPDNDFLYIVDSLDKHAYFASQRESETNKVHVYKVRLERLPMEMVVLAGNFNSEINPTHKTISIEVNDATGDLVGKFTSNNKGEYNIRLPKKGKYEFVVKLDKNDKKFKETISIPKVNSFRPLKQTITEIEKDGENLVVFNNLFNEKVENYDEILAEAIEAKAKMNINRDLFNLDSLDKIQEQKKVFDQVGLAQYTNVEIRDLIQTKFKDLYLRQTSTDSLILKSRYIVQNGNDAIKKAVKSADSLMQLSKENPEDPQKERWRTLSAREIEKSKAIQQDMLNAQIILSHLEKDYAEKESLLATAKNLNNSIKDLKTSNTKGLIDAVSKYPTFVSEELLVRTKTNAYFEYLAVINDELRLRDNLISTKDSLNRAKQATQTELAKLERAYAAASKREKEDISFELSKAEIRLEGLENEIKYTEEVIAEKSKIADQKQTLAQISRSPIKEDMIAEHDLAEEFENLLADIHEIENNADALPESKDIAETEQETENNSENEIIAENQEESADLNTVEETDKKEESNDQAEEQITVIPTLFVLDPEYADDIARIEKDIENGSSSKNQLVERKTQAISKIQEAQVIVAEQSAENPGDINLSRTNLSLNKLEEKLLSEVAVLQTEIDAESGIIAATTENEESEQLAENETKNMSSANEEADPEKTEEIKGEESENPSTPKAVSLPTLAEIDSDYVRDIAQLEAAVNSGETDKTALIARKNQAIIKVKDAIVEVNDKQVDGAQNEALTSALEALSSIEQSLISDVEKLEREIASENEMIAEALASETTESTEENTANETEEKSSETDSTQAELIAENKEVSEAIELESNEQLNNIVLEEADNSINKALLEIDSDYTEDIAQIQKDIEQGNADRNALIKRRYQAALKVHEAKEKTTTLLSQTPEDLDLAMKVDLLNNLENRIYGEIETIENAIKEDEELLAENNKTNENSEIETNTENELANNETEATEENESTNENELVAETNEEAAEESPANAETESNSEIAENTENSENTQNSEEAMNENNANIESVNNELANNEAEATEENESTNENELVAEINEEATEESQANAETENNSEIAENTENTKNTQNSEEAMNENNANIESVNNELANNEAEATEENESTNENELVAEINEEATEESQANAETENNSEIAENTENTENTQNSEEAMNENNANIESANNELANNETEATEENESTNENELVAETTGETAEESQANAETENNSEIAENTENAQNSEEATNENNANIESANNELANNETEATEENESTNENELVAETTGETAEESQANAETENNSEIAENTENAQNSEEAMNENNANIESANNELASNETEATEENESTDENELVAETTGETAEESQANAETENNSEIAENTENAQNSEEATNENNANIESVNNELANNEAEATEENESTNENELVAETNEGAAEESQANAETENNSEIAENSENTESTQNSKEATNENNASVESVNNELANNEAEATEENESTNENELVAETNEESTEETQANDEITIEDMATVSNPERVLELIDPNYLSEVAQIEQGIQEGTKTNSDLIKRKYKVLIDVGDVKSETLREEEINPTPIVAQKLKTINTIENQIVQEIDDLESHELVASSNNTESSFEDVLSISTISKEDIPRKIENSLTDKSQSKINKLFKEKEELELAIKANPALAENKKTSSKMNKIENEIASELSIALQNSLITNYPDLVRKSDQLLQKSPDEISSLSAQQSVVKIEQILQKSGEQKSAVELYNLFSEAFNEQEKTLKLIKDTRTQKQIDNYISQAVEELNLENIETKTVALTANEIMKEQNQLNLKLVNLNEQINELNAMVINANRQNKNAIEFNINQLNLIKTGLENRLYENSKALDKIEEQQRADANKGISKEAIKNTLTYKEEVEIAQSKEYIDQLRNNNRLTQAQYELRIKEAQLNDEQTELKEIYDEVKTNGRLTDEKKEAIKTQLAAISKTKNDVARLRENVQNKQNDVAMSLPNDAELRYKTENMIARDVAPLKAMPIRTSSLALVKTGLVIGEKAKAIYSDENPIPIIREVNDQMSGLVYRVQIGAFRNPVPNETFNQFSPISGDNIGSGWIKYVVGLFGDREIAGDARDKIRALGYSDAFIVAYCDGERIPVYRAVELASSGACISEINDDEDLIAETDNDSDSTARTLTTITKSNELDEFAYNKTIGSAEADVVENKAGLFYTVQVGVYNTPATSEQLSNVSPLITKRLPTGLIRYSSGVFDSYDAAIPKRNQVVEKGISDAYIVAYYKGLRITASEANAILKAQGDVVLQSNMPKPRRNEMANNNVTSIANETQEAFINSSNTKNLLVSTKSYPEFPIQELNRYNEEGELFYYDSKTQKIQSFLFDGDIISSQFMADFEKVSVYNNAYSIINESTPYRKNAIENPESNLIHLEVAINNEDLNSDLMEVILNTPVIKEMQTNKNQLLVNFYAVDVDNNQNVVDRLQAVLTKLGATEITKTAKTF